MGYNSGGVRVTLWVLGILTPADLCVYLLVHDGAHELFDRRQGHIGGVQIHRFPGEADLQQEGHAVEGLAGVGRARGARTPVRQSTIERGGGARGGRGRKWGGGMRGDGKRSREGRRGRAAQRGHLHSFALFFNTYHLRNSPACLPSLFQSSKLISVLSICFFFTSTLFFDLQS